MTTRTDTAVSVRGLTRRFGANTVLHGLDLELEPGSGFFVEMINSPGDWVVGRS